MPRVQKKSRKSKMPFEKRLKKIREKVDERMQHNSSQPSRSNLSIKNDSYDNSFNLFKQAVAERRANNIVAKMMERNSSLLLAVIYQLKIIQIVIDSNHLKILLLEKSFSKKKIMDGTHKCTS